MLGFLPPFLRGVIALFLLALNTLFWCTLLFAFALVKLVLPFAAVRRRIDPVLNGIATLLDRLQQRLDAADPAHRWDVQGVDALRYEGWYLVNCNHQSWADIFVLQHLLNRRIPMLKFFLKQQLIYVPVIGLAWWALDFPFMKRHGKAELRKRPELRGQDAEATRRACEKFALVPTSVMNFAEGTRFTAAKHRVPVIALSPPAQAQGRRAGAGAERHGRAFPFADRRDHRLSRRRAQFLAVPLRQGARGSWCACASCRSRREFCAGDYSADPAFRVEFQRWLAGLWEDKDREIDALLARDGDAIAPAARREPQPWPASALGLALGLALLAPAPADAMRGAQAPGLRAKYAALEPQLRNSQFQGPLYLDSVETRAAARATSMAWSSIPSPASSAALAKPANWCDILILHLNIKYCRGNAGPGYPAGGAGRAAKYDQPVTEASLLAFAWRAVAATPRVPGRRARRPRAARSERATIGSCWRRCRSRAAAPSSTWAMRSATAALGQLAMSTYLATIGRDKVGFTPAARPIGGSRATSAEPGAWPSATPCATTWRSTPSWRALSAPPAEQLENAGWRHWFAATEKYPAQLHEMRPGQLPGDEAQRVSPSAGLAQ